MKRNKQLLALLVLVLLGAIIYAYKTTPVQQRVDSTSRLHAGRSVASQGDSPDRSETTLQLERLQRQAEGSAKVKRDIFNFWSPPVKKPPVKAPEVVIAPPPPPPPPPPVVKVAVPSARFTYLGLLRKAGEMTFFLSVDDTLAVVKKGERFGDQSQYLLKDYNDENLTIGQDGSLPDLSVKIADAREPQVLPAPAASVRPAIPGLNLQQQVPATTVNPVVTPQSPARSAAPRPQLQSFKRYDYYQRSQP